MGADPERSDRDEFVEFVSARLPKLRRAGQLLCGGDLDRGDDVVQQTLTELFRNWPRARRADNLDGLVRTMLVRRFLDERRRRWSKVWLPGAVPDVEAPSTVDPGVRLDLYRAMAKLAPRQRSVLVLRYFYDLTVEQTAEELGTAPGTVKSQTSRALDALRALLGDDANPLVNGRRNNG